MKYKKINMNSKVYIGLDGDSIGRVIESLLIKNEPKEVVIFSKKIVSALESIRLEVLELNGDVLFCSGDSILIYGNFEMEFCNSILAKFKNETGRTASIGIGRTTAEAYLGLKLAKSKGGNSAEFYEIRERP